MQLLSQCGSTDSCLTSSVPEILWFVAGMLSKQPAKNNNSIVQCMKMMVYFLNISRAPLPVSEMLGQGCHQNSSHKTRMACHSTMPHSLQGVKATTSFLLFLFLFSSFSFSSSVFPSLISGIHHFWVRFLRV